MYINWCFITQIGIGDIMKRTSISETRKQLSNHLKWVSQTGEDVIIHNRGEDEAVIISMESYQLLEEARERRRQREALDRLKVIAEKNRAAYEISREEAEAVADEITREAIKRSTDGE